MLVVFGIYKALDGQIPFTSAQLTDWLGVFGVIIIETFVTFLIVIPIILQLYKHIGIKPTPQTWLSTYIPIAAISYFMNPFAIIGALLYARSGETAFVLFIIGIYAVNFLAYSLSQTNIRSQQHARELRHLEALGQEIMQAPPDASTLAEMIRAVVARMFGQDLIAIKIFDTAEPTVWQPFQLTHSVSKLNVPESAWDKIRQSEDPTLIEKKVVLPAHKSALGDAVMVKIQGADTQALLGGIYFLRPKINGKSSDSLAALQTLASQIASALHRAEDLCRNPCP